jgi:hypothetical protein
MGFWVAVSTMLLSTSALAQQTPPVVVVPDSTTGVAPPMPALDYTLRPGQKVPLSARLLQVQYGTGFGNPFGVQQGYGKFPGSELPRLVAASHQARSLALEANDKFALSTGLLIGGLASDLGALGTAIAGAATIPNNLNQLPTTSAVLLGVSVGLLVVGVGLTLGGSAVMQEAINRWLDAVNTYNRQLVDGQLDAVPSS